MLRFSRNITAVTVIIVIIFFFALIKLTPETGETKGDCELKNRSVVEQTTIHAVSIVGGTLYVAEFASLLRSVIVQTPNPLHFHIITNNKTQTELEALFSSWEIPEVSTSYYEIETFIPSLEWIPTHHYAGYYTLIKMIIAEILPDTIKKVILLDVDVLFLCNISEVWNQFNNMNTSYLGIAQDMNELYRQYTKWPMMDNGYNTGVILMDLERMRNQNYSELWKETAQKYLHMVGEPMVGEQDIFNSLVTNYPYILYTLPPEYNVQIGWVFKTVDKFVNGAKVIHRNNMEKTLKYPQFADSYKLYGNMTIKEVKDTRLEKDRKRSSIC